MIPKRIIEKAIEGGWQSKIFRHKNFVADTGSYDFQVVDTETGAVVLRLPYAEIALDPTFWQALGKSLGWKDWEGKYSPAVNIQLAWQYEAHRFYDLILTGQSTEQFWEEILSASLEKGK